MECRKCGTNNEDGRTFCVGCGSILPGATLSSKKNISNPTPTVNYNYSTPKKPRKKININFKKIIFLLLIIIIPVLIGYGIFRLVQYNNNKPINVPDGYVRFGTDKYGYINVPENWTIQIEFAYDEDQSIVEFAVDDNKDKLSLKDYVYEKYDNLNSELINDKSIKKAKVNNKEAYLVTIDVNNNSNIKYHKWYVMDKNKKVRIITIQSSDTEVIDLIKTYNLNK